MSPGPGIPWNEDFGWRQGCQSLLRGRHRPLSLGVVDPAGKEGTSVMAGDIEGQSPGSCLLLTGCAVEAQGRAEPLGCPH